MLLKLIYLSFLVASFTIKGILFKDVQIHLVFLKNFVLILFCILMLLSFNHDIFIKGWGIVKYFCTAHIFTFYLNIQVELYDTKKQSKAS